MQPGQPRPAVGVAQRTGAAGQDEHPQPLVGALADGVVAGQVGLGERGANRRGRPEHERGAVGEGDPAPAQRRAELDLVDDLAALAGQGLVGGEGRRGGVGARHRAGERAEQLPRAGLVAARRHYLDEGESPAGQRPGLVGADDVDAAEGLDRVGPLHQRAAPGHPRRAHGVGHGDEEEQAVGDQAGEHRGGLHEPQHGGAVEGGLGEDRAAHQQNQQDEQTHHQIDPPLQRRQRGRVRARRDRQPAGVAVRSDRLGAQQALATRARAAREQHVADGLGDRCGLPAEQRLVHLDPRARAVRRHQRAVGHDLVSAPHTHEVADDDLRRRDPPFGAVAHDGDGLARQQLQPVELALRAQLLDRRECGVDDAESDAHEGVAVAAEREQRDPDHEERVVVEREDGRPQDAGSRATRARDRGVGPALPGELAGPCLCQPLDRHRRHPDLRSPRGRWSMNVAPPPRVGWTVTDPWCWCAICWVRARPRPAPPWPSRAREGSVR